MFQPNDHQSSTFPNRVQKSESNLNEITKKNYFNKNKHLEKTLNLKKKIKKKFHKINPE
jgi:hypothetical protein